MIKIQGPGKTCCDKQYENFTSIVKKIQKDTLSYKTKMTVSSTEPFQCVLCESKPLFSTKQNLLKHVRFIHKRKCVDQDENVEVETFNCASNKCTYTTMYRGDLTRHVAKCMFVVMDREIELTKQQMQQEYESKLQAQVASDQQNVTNFQEIATRLQGENELLKQQLKTVNEQLQRVYDLAEKAINRPVFVDNNSDKEEHEEVSPKNVSDKMEAIESYDHMFYLSQISLNNVTITSRHPDHYVNATELCQAGDKKFNDWYRLESTKELVAVLSSDTGIPATQLIESKRGASSHYQQGSWIHPDLAIQLAQWISPSFALHVCQWVRSLFSQGSVAIDLALIKVQQKTNRHAGECLPQQEKAGKI